MNNKLGPKSASLASISLEGVPSGTGVLIEEVSLHPDVGPEAAVLLFDPDPEEVLLGDNLDLRLRAGVASTDYGPILFLIWWIPPLVNGRPVAFYEQVLNPLSERIPLVLQRLASQTHLHLLVIDRSGLVRNTFEYVNNFGFGAVRTAAALAKQEWHGMSDFHRAKRAYQEMYEVSELLAGAG